MAIDALSGLADVALDRSLEALDARDGERFRFYDDLHWLTLELIRDWS